jgi:hypothetical protein
VPGVDADEQPAVGTVRRVAAADDAVVLERVPVAGRDADDLDRGLLHGVAFRECLSRAPGDPFVSRRP